MRHTTDRRPFAALSIIAAAVCCCVAANTAWAQAPAATDAVSNEGVVARSTRSLDGSPPVGSAVGSWRVDRLDGQLSATVKSLATPQSWACNPYRVPLGTPSYAGSGDGEGGGRAIGFSADREFTLNGVGISGDLIEQSFDVVIYASTDGHTAGSVLATFSGTIGGAGFGWNVVPVKFRFQEGEYYVVNWRPTTASNWANSIDYYADSGLPASIGPLTVLEGFSGADAETPDNIYHPYFTFLVDGDCNCQENDLATPSFYNTTGGVGSGRGIGFRTDVGFELSAVGIKGDLNEMSFDVVIYDSPDGHSAGDVLATFSSTAGGTGYGWNIVPVSFKFIADRYYVVNWRPTVAAAWANTIDYYHDFGLPATVGPVTILEGIQGGDAEDPANSLHPHLSFCIRGSCNVAILGSPGAPMWNYDVQQKLIDTARFAQVDVINIASETPSLPQLQSYAAVLIYSDWPGYLDSTTFGDNLADYVDSGGGVVTATFANASIPFAGRFHTDNYWVIYPSSQTSGASSLGAVYTPSHPLLEGVGSFDGGPGSYRPSTFSVEAGATRVADWADGRPLVAYKNFGTTRRVDLGFFPPSSDSDGYFWNVATDGALLMANALEWVATPGCADRSSEIFSNPLGEWRKRWLYLNSNLENYYTASGSNCDPSYRGNQPYGLWISDDRGCSSLVGTSPVTVDLINGVGDLAQYFSLDHFVCASGVTLNIYDKDGVLAESNPVPADCWNFSPFTTQLTNGISAIEYVQSGGAIEGSTSIDNVVLYFSFFSDGFESGTTSAWSNEVP